MRSYEHLTIDQRIDIRLFLSSGHSLRTIAQKLNFHPSTISRELKRNSDKNGCYVVQNAQKLYEQRRLNCRRKCRLTKSPSLFRHTKKSLLKLFSPEVTAYLYRKQKKGRKLSGNTIRKALINGLFGDITPVRVLRRKGIKKYKGISSTIRTTPDREIANRTAEFSDRDCFGNWEVDTVIGKHKTGLLVTLVERSTRLVISQYCSSKSSKEVANAIITALKDLPCKSLTYDRGSEFAAYKDMEEALSTRTFFADPRSPWQRGSNENVNKMIRAFYPKGTDFRIFQDKKRLALLVKYINNTPRRIFDYATSACRAKRHLRSSMSRVNHSIKEQIISISSLKLQPPINV